MTLAEEDLAAQGGGMWGPDIKAAVVGTRLDVAVPTILRFFGAPDTPAQVAETSAWLLRRMVELFGESLVPGATELVAAQRAEGVPQALVLSSFRVLVDAALAQGVGPFALSVAGDEVVHGKPHPEPYLTAARRLGAGPVRCVVVEDSPSGVAPGEAARWWPCQACRGSPSRRRPATGDRLARPGRRRPAPGARLTGHSAQRCVRSHVLGPAPTAARASSGSLLATSMGARSSAA